MQNYEIIDIHTHTFPDAIAKETVCSLEGRSHTHSFSDGTVEGLSSAIKGAGVSLAVVQPVVTNPLKTEKINRAAAEVNEHTDETHVFSFGGMHPDTPNYKEELKRIKELGLKGVKLHPAYQHHRQTDAHENGRVGESLFVGETAKEQHDYFTRFS